MPKKLISAMLMLALLCSSLAIPTEFHLTASGADNATYWNDEENNIYKYADFTPFDPNKEGKGKGIIESNPYTINTAAQLAALAILVNNTDSENVNGINNSSATCSDFQGKYIKLTADIDLSDHQWVPIGDNTKPFKGNFDGCGYTIKNMHIGGNPDINGTAANYNYAGLFGYVQADNNQTVTIQNVNIGTGSWVYTSGQFAGGICAYAIANAALTISNCCNSGSVTAASTSGTAYAGGICAYAAAKATITISNCSNSATVSSSSSPYYYANAGGICAFAKPTTSAMLTISNCSNSGSVTATSTSGTAYAGGICAFARAYASAMLTISNCSNSGSVTATSTSGTAYAGGICAFASADGKIEISNCYYLNSSTNNGVGITRGRGSVTKTTTPLQENQMKAEAKSSEPPDGDAWKPITVTYTDSNNTTTNVITEETVPLVDALNAWVKAYNNGKPAVEAIGWYCDGESYPTLCLAIPYIDRTWNDATKTMTKTTRLTPACTAVLNDTTTWTNNAYGGWYVVTTDTTIDGTVTVTGDVKLILCDNKKLTSNAGITVESGATLTIYAQSEGKSMGKLVVKGADGTKGTDGGNAFSGSGTVTINGGEVTATGGDGGNVPNKGSKDNYGRKGGDGGFGFSNTVTINGGNVSATGGNGGTGGTGGRSLNGGNGGRGRNAFSNTVTINGGNVSANGGNGGNGGRGLKSGTGDGGNGGNGGNAFSNTVTIDGGNVSATGGNGGTGGTGLNGGNATNGSSGQAFSSAATIDGGNIKVDKTSNVTFKNSADTTVLLKTYTLDGLTSQTRVHSVEGVSNYGLNDVHTLDTNKLYFYLPAGENVTRVETATGQPFKAQSANSGDNTLYAVLFRAQTTLGYILSEKTSADKGNIPLPTLAVLQTKSETKNLIENTDQLAWYSGNTKILDSSVSIGDEYKLVTAKYEVDGKSVGDEIDNKHIVEVVDDGALYVGVFETTDIEGVTESDKVVGIQPKDTNKFLCWVGNVDNDEDLEVLSYRDTYYFYARTDRTIIAVYEKDTIAQSIAALEGQNADSIDVCANIESVDTVKNDDGTTAGFRVVSMCSVPHTQEKENYIIDWAGILATKNKDIGIGKSDINFESSLTGRSGTIEGANSDVMVRGHDSEANNTQFTWIRKPNGNETWYVRAYLVYRKNAEATQQYKHGEIFKIEFNNDTVNWTSVPEGGSN